MSKWSQWVAAGACATVLNGAAQAAIVYSGGTYSQNFDSLPNTPHNASIETTYTDGWQDDVDPAVSAQSDVSIPGWYLWHPVSPASENGFNGNQRMRFGDGANNTGAFWSYGTSATTDRALGSLGSTTIANQPTGTPPANDTRVLRALRITNGTGGTLGSFTLVFDAEQWRDGNNTTHETTAFQYQIGATAIHDADFWITPAGDAGSYSTLQATAVAGAMDGNNALNRHNDVTVTASGLTWLPGTDLWLRWNDPQVLGNDHGMAIDDLTFTAAAAVPEPAGLAVLGLGLLARRRTR